MDTPPVTMLRLTWGAFIRMTGQKQAAVLYFFGTVKHINRLMK